MSIVTGSGQTYTDQEVKDWFNVNDPTHTNDGAVAKRAAELGGLDQGEIANALTIGRGGQNGTVQDPAKVGQWVAEPNSGYGWDSQGGLIFKQGQRPPAASGSSGYSPAQLGNPTSWNVTPDQTVEGRVASIINGNSPLQVQARSRSLDAMNSRGLANSSLAITAGEDAAYNAALPIATADASTFAKAAGYNADQSNQFTVRNADYSNQFGLAEIQARTSMSTAQLNSDTARYTANLDSASRERATQFQASNNTLLQTNQQAAGAFNAAMSAVNNIQMNNQMDADTKTKAVANVWHDLQTQFRVLGSVAGLDLTSQLNFAGYPGFDAQGNWVGNAPAATPAPTAAPASIVGTAETGGNSV